MLAVVAPVLQVYVPPPVAVSVAGVPEQITPLFTVATGLAAIVTVPLAVAVQLPILVAVTVYVPAVVVVILAVVAPVLHTYTEPPVAVSLAVLPAQIAVSLTVGVGSGFTVMIPEAVAVHASASVTVTENTPAVRLWIVSVVLPVLQR